MSRRVDKRTEQLEKYLSKHHHRLLEIDEWRMTDHAATRMFLRGIEIDDVREALRQPSRPCSKGRQKRVGEIATVVVQPSCKLIVTVGYGSLYSIEEQAS